jgi:hypothetical protein
MAIQQRFFNIYINDHKSYNFISYGFRYGYDLKTYDSTKLSDLDKLTLDQIGIMGIVSPTGKYYFSTDIVEHRFFNIYADILSTTPPPSSGEGEPIGLLLALTKA